ncbi:HAD-IA family hydrolase [Halioxenophilus sp. WMMB6]|uniref:HAD family hydrolase n=1 Tax=Halioxenophilus sp. WMMB6 TaxID=3073815 RepID=UPI00295ED5F7|nr:HAD-IA family hydrolase [Halioxenophilus sp. WMMB6]
MKHGCALFDLDGTLVDTAPDFILVLNQMRSQQGLPALPEATIRKTVSGGAREMVKLAFGGQSGEPAFDAHLAEFLDLYGQLIGRGESRSLLFPGLTGLLQELRARQIPWGIVTNKPDRFASQLITTLALEPAVLICPDHVTRAKPDPEPLLLACEMIGSPAEQSIYVGDHQRDIEAGRNANMQTVVVGWGYFDEPEPLSAWQAHHMADSAQQLSDLLLAQL